jgi:hypothetical protein
VKLLADGVARTLSGGHSLSESAAGLSRGLEVLLSTLRECDSEAKIDALLSQAPDPTPEQLKMLGGIVAVLPAAVTELVREGLENATANMPGAKTGPKTISTLEKVSICQQVNSLIGTGCRNGVAILRVSQRTNRSVRSVRRIWMERCNLQTTCTLDEVKDGVLALLLGGGTNLEPEAGQEAAVASAE